MGTGARRSATAPGAMEGDDRCFPVGPVLARSGIHSIASSLNEVGSSLKWTRGNYPASLGLALQRSWSIHSLYAQSWYYQGKGYDPQGPLWGAQVSFPCGYCCYNQCQYRNMERRVTEKRAALPLAPREGGWLGIPFGQMCWVLALRL